MDLQRRVRILSDFRDLLADPDLPDTTESARLRVHEHLRGYHHLDTRRSRKSREDDQKTGRLILEAFQTLEFEFDSRYDGDTGLVLPGFERLASQTTPLKYGGHLFVTRQGRYLKKRTPGRKTQRMMRNADQMMVDGVMLLCAMNLLIQMEAYHVAYRDDRMISASDDINTYDIPFHRVEFDDILRNKKLKFKTRFNRPAVLRQVCGDLMHARKKDESVELKVVHEYFTRLAYVLGCD